MMTDKNNYFTFISSAFAVAGASANIDITGNGKTKAYSQVIQPPFLWIHKANLRSSL